MKVAIIGANGQLGMDLQEAFREAETVPLTHADIEIADVDAVHSALQAVRPSLVINTAAYHKVDDCEKNPDQAFRINGLGALNLARVCEGLGCELLHVSTDYVFDGAKQAPYAETDLPHPLNVYGVTKLAGEQFVRSYASRHYVVRSSGLYGHHPCRAKGGKNFIDTMLGLARAGKEITVVADEVLTPTYTRHLAEQIRTLVGTGQYGLYHITSNGSCSWYDFAAEIFRNAGLAPVLKPSSARNNPSPIKRPSYSVLDNRRLAGLGLDTMPDWKTSLNHYFQTKSSPSSVA